METTSAMSSAGDDGLVGNLAPAFAQFFQFGLELDFAIAQVDGVVESLGFEGLFFFLLEAFEIDEGFAQADGVGRFVHADAAAGLVDEVDGFVGHEAVGHVTCGQVGGGIEGFIGNDEFVVFLVAAFYAFEDLDCFFDAGFFDQDWLEAAFEGGVAFDMFAIFVEGGGADDLELAAAEGGFEDIGGVDAAAGGAGADEHMDFVNEKDGAAIDNFFDYFFEAFFELAAVHGNRRRGCQHRA